VKVGPPFLDAGRDRRGSGSFEHLLLLHALELGGGEDTVNIG